MSFTKELQCPLASCLFEDARVFRASVLTSHCHVRDAHQKLIKIMDAPVIAATVDDPVEISR